VVLIDWIISAFLHFNSSTQLRRWEKFQLSKIQNRMTACETQE